MRLTKGQKRYLALAHALDGDGHTRAAQGYSLNLGNAARLPVPAGDAAI